MASVLSSYTHSVVLMIASFTPTHFLLLIKDFGKQFTAYVQSDALYTLARLNEANKLWEITSMTRRILIYY